jgi:D-psicose/D-tagatose/L-ribulose 3-epimerase
MNPVGIISMFYARPFQREHFPLLSRMRDAQMDFVELLIPEPDELDLLETRSALKDHGLGVELAARVNLSRDLASDDDAAYSAGIAYLRTCIDIAVKLGAKRIGGPLYGAPLVFAGRPPIPVPEAIRLRRIDRVVDGLRAVADEAGDKGVLFCVEPLNRFETDFCMTTRNGIDLVDRIAKPSVGLMLDTFHMAMEDDGLAEAIRLAGKRIIHFQANENHRGFIGSGHLDWSAIARALLDVGYKGPITLEPFRRDEHRLGVSLAQWRAPEGDETARLAASAAHLRNVLALASIRTRDARI